ncbi:FkbM family methyltransferase [Pontibacter locisalis]|uniref:FkbM family methyltransferase n=1 Tax=Pontibacter locisalis TaxID=1719035 RepID=A0ABW5IRF1_9BACT
MKTIVKKILPHNSFVLSFYRKLYWRYVSYKRGHPVAWNFDILKTYARIKNHVNFLQIGSNNGISGDPICDLIKERGWQGVLVEPVPFLYEELKHNYREFHDQLSFENSAIAHVNGRQKFYRIKEVPGLPQWYSQLGSFNKDVIVGHKSYIPDFDNLFIEDYVNTITFNDLLAKYSIKSLNLIHIDTEGFDYEIAQMIPFSSLDVDLVMFEHKHLSSSDYAGITKLLRDKGYKVGKNDSVDTIAVKKKILRALQLT